MDTLTSGDPCVWALSPWVTEVVGHAVLAMERLPADPRAVVRGLHGLRALALQRLRPAKARAALAANAGLEVAFWLSGWILLLLLGRAQSHGGRRSSAHARTRQACTPTDLARGLAGPPSEASSRAMAASVSGQLVGLGSAAGRPPVAVYVLASSRHMYVGMTCAAQQGRRPDLLAPPCRRVWQHFAIRRAPWVTDGVRRR